MDKAGAGRIGAVIMAAGRGTRMRCDSVHKVCFPLGGRPTINRTLDMLNECGIGDHYIVVGHLAEQVMAAAGASAGRHCFCWQAQPRGTGHAARVAAEVLAGNPAIDAVLVIAGDKVIERATLQALVAQFHREKADLAFIVGDAASFRDSGRMITDEQGRPAGIVEVFDIARMELLLALRHIAAERSLTAAEAEEIARGYFRRESKAERALGPLWETIKLGGPVTAELLARNFQPADFQLRLNGRLFPPEALAGVRHANLSVYLYRRQAFLESLRSLDADNAQQEEYLTDTVGILAAAGARVTPLAIDDPRQVMAYNTPEEIREIERHLAASEPAFVREEPQTLRRPSDWLRHLETGSPEARRWFRDTWGPGADPSGQKRKLLVGALRSFRERFGDRPALIARAPGRVNVMGRHIDHQGGAVNMVAIDRDIFCVMAPAREPRVAVADIQHHRYPERSFALAELAVDGRRPWLEWLEDPAREAALAAGRGDWVQYVQGAFARLAHQRPGAPPGGADLLVAGDLPAGGGVSSSSALFVAVTEGAAALNGFSFSPEELSAFCGEGEWYVGTRGGAGDHAAIKCSRPGAVTQLSFFPLRVKQRVPFPGDWRLVLANSGHRAHKTRGVKHIFNQRVACYRLGRALLAARCPETAALGHLRDFVDGRFSDQRLLQLAAHLPQKASRAALAGDPATRDLLGDCHGETFPLREVFLFGLAECRRGERAAALLRQGALAAFGRLMNASHDGDRVVRWRGDDFSLPFAPDYSDQALARLAAAAAAGEHDLAGEPGAYSCSTPAIDRMVDIAVSLPRVAGAQLSGAGLGGCIMVLLPGESCPELETALVRRYYEPASLDPDLFTVTPAAGSGLVCF